MKEQARADSNQRKSGPSFGKHASTMSGMNDMNIVPNADGSSGVDKSFSAVRNPLFDINASGLICDGLVGGKEEVKESFIQENNLKGRPKQPVSWASLFRGTQLVDVKSQNKNLDDKLRKIQNASLNEVNIDDELILNARSGWSNSLYEDLNKVLTEGPWFFKGQALLLTPWRANFQPLLEKIEAIPVWIQLPGLSLEYLRKDILLNIVRSIGQPIKIDGITLKGQRAKFARICILWNLNNKVPSGIWVNGGGVRFWQAIAFENIPKLFDSLKELSEKDTQKIKDISTSHDKTLDKISVSSKEISNINVKIGNVITSKVKQTNDIATSPMEAENSENMVFKSSHKEPVLIQIEVEKTLESFHRNLTDIFTIVVEKIKESVNPTKEDLDEEMPLSTEFGGGRVRKAY
ncbi:hypothetical protein Cni_G12675 [Canna indica]|uniref:DUF4283 domain-containing protein n=1 Tax=Canna indica TaxID=4628 RepID=A0AAQ3K8S0_9LILI|nr:hypothetical protein Cni_G12675 [Canna indica]